jgi:hypothetical protein
MCGHEDSGGHLSVEGDGRAPGVNRRDLLRGGAALLGATVLSRPSAAVAGSTSSSTLSGMAPVIAAMHVHASHSEGPGSWEQQYANAAAAGVDVLWQTDHDFRARALNYMTLLRGTFLGSTTGSWAQHAATFSAAGPIRVLVESAGAAPATQSLVMEEKPTAVNLLRTGIQGQSIAHAFGTSRLDAGAKYEFVVRLSLHPAQTGRPAGQYSLRYRFITGASRARFTEGNGLIGVVRAAMPPGGTTVTLTPEADIAALWPDMLAADHSCSLVSFVCTSPRKGVVADVNLRSVTINRPRHDAASVAAAQQRFAQTYSSRYGVTGLVSEEVSLGPEAIAHCNVFGAPPEWALKQDVTLANWQTYYRDWINRVHGRAGLVSWNHPLGFAEGPELTQAEADQRRRSAFATQSAHDLLGSDLLEVGYALRGFVPFAQHLALWDTFSRRARWLTGNGVSDDHSGRDWRPLRNGFLTGIWAPTLGQGDLVRALAGGRAYTYHPNHCPGLGIDTLVGGVVPMGGAAVSSRTSQTVTLALTNLPAGATVEVVRGPVDFTGQDPATTTVASIPASSFGANGTGNATVQVSTTSQCFIRPQVRQNGTLTASGNPTWLLRQEPPGGIPSARRAG